ncbi:hypothetical protein [Streptomyces sp. NPDC093149]|uniref:hypothetical protein n=1 Tax=Streptomyces sp. NPDC093149 TaxID=3366031 RepID=UPI00382D51AC
MERLGRDAAELTALADYLTAHGLVLEMFAGLLPGIYDPTGPGKLLFAFFAAMAETERGTSASRRWRGSTPRPARASTAAGPRHHRRHAPHRAPAPRERRVRQADPARPDHPTGKRKGHNPSVASIYCAGHERWPGDALLCGGWLRRGSGEPVVASGA